MKHLYTLIMTGVLIPFLAVNAENSEGTDEALSSSIYAPQEEAPLSSLEEELSLLDEEFEEFKEELFSLENELQTKQVAPAQENAPSSANVAITSEPEEKSIVDTPSVFPTEVAIHEEIAPPLELQDESLENQEIAMVEENGETEFPAVLNVEGVSFVGEPSSKKAPISVDLNQAFASSPIIYSILFFMSVTAMGIWMYSILSLKRSVQPSNSLFKTIQSKLSSNHFEEAMSLCLDQNNLFCKMVASGIQSRRHGLPLMIEAMKAEGKRASTSFWQKLGLLNDIAIIAPMIGLLGTVLGMFYAFYDINRSIESVSTLFDGLGVSVGTTVAGLIVAILALILHSTAKYRLVRALASIENEAQHVASLIDDRTSIYKG